MKYDYNEIIEILFNEGKTSPLILDNGTGIGVAFERVFAVEHNQKPYCILKPLIDIEGLDDHSALVFRVDENGVFHAVKDKRLTKRIFSEYYNS